MAGRTGKKARIHSLPESVRRRLEALRNMADENRGGSASEVAQAAKLMAELLAKYNLDATESVDWDTVTVENFEDATGMRIIEMTWGSRSYGRMKGIPEGDKWLAGAVCSLFDVVPLIGAFGYDEVTGADTGVQVVRFIGTQQNVLTALGVADWVRATREKYLAAEMRQGNYADRQGQNDYRDGFSIAVAKNCTEIVKERNNARPRMEIVQRDAINAWMDEMYPSRGRANWRTYGRNSEAYGAGAEKGASVNPLGGSQKLLR